MRPAYLIALASLILAPVPVAAATTPPYISARIITPGTPVPTGGAGVAVACSGPGTMRLVFPNGTTLDIYAQLGTALIDNMEVVDVAAIGSNAPCTISVLYRTLPRDPL